MQGAHAKAEQQERELGGAHQKLQMLEEQLAQLQQESATLSLQKAELDHLQGMHAEHAHIYRQAAGLCTGTGRLYDSKRVGMLCMKMCIQLGEASF